MLDSYEHGYHKALMDMERAFEILSIPGCGVRITRKLVTSLLHLLVSDTKARDMFRVYGGDVCFKISSDNRIIDIQEE